MPASRTFPSTGCYRGKILKLLYFAWVRERIGQSSEEVECPEGVTTVGELIGWLAERGGGYAEAFENTALVRTAVNHDHVDASHPVTDDDEVAFFPPVTGG